MAEINKKQAESTYANKIRVKTRHLRKRYLNVMMGELSSDEAWNLRVAEHLKCEPENAKEKSKCKMQEMLQSGMDRTLIKPEQDNKAITFRCTIDAYNFFEQLSNIFQCNLVINEVRVQTNMKHLKTCIIELEDKKLRMKLTNVKKDTKVVDEEEKKNSVESNKHEITDQDINVLEKILDETIHKLKETRSESELAISESPEYKTDFENTEEIQHSKMKDPENKTDFENDEEILHSKMKDPENKTDFENDEEILHSKIKDPENKTDYENDEEIQHSKMIDSANVRRKNLKRKIEEEEEEEDEDEEEEEIKRRFETFRTNLKSLNLKKGSKRKLLIKHLDETLPYDIKTNLERFSENIPKIQKIFETIYSFVKILEKTAKQIPSEEIDSETGRHWKVCCEGCPIHCIPNWSFTNPTGRPKKNILQ